MGVCGVYGPNVDVEKEVSLGRIGWHYELVGVAVVYWRCFLCEKSSETISSYIGVFKIYI
jgi:hypothetical protein